MSKFENKKSSLKKKFVFTLSIAIALGIVSYIYFAFVKKDEFISKARLSFNMSSKYKSLYGIYEEEYSDADLFKMMMTDFDLINQTTDSLNLIFPNSEFQKSIKWKELSATDTKSIVEVSFTYDNSASTILRTHLYFYEKKINAYLENNMFSYFSTKLSIELPLLEADLEKTTSIISQLKEDLELITHPIDKSNAQYGLPIFNPSFSAIKESIEATKLEQLVLQKRLAQKKEQLTDLHSCQCVPKIDLNNAVVNVLEITESDNPVPKNAKRNAAIAFSGVMLVAFFIFALSKMTYIPNE